MLDMVSAATATEQNICSQLQAVHENLTNASITFCMLFVY